MLGDYFTIGLYHCGVTLIILFSYLCYELLRFSHCYITNQEWPKTKLYNILHNTGKHGFFHQNDLDELPQMMFFTTVMMCFSFFLFWPLVDLAILWLIITLRLKYFYNKKQKGTK